MKKYQKPCIEVMALIAATPIANSECDDTQTGYYEDSTGNSGVNKKCQNFVWSDKAS